VVDWHIVTGFSVSNLTSSAGEGTISGQRVGDTRVSALDENTARRLDAVVVDRTFADSVSGKDVDRPQLAAMLAVGGEGDAVIVHFMDRLPQPR
jgi:DNA invertase Pin-like site-specific DNA recombinase